MAFSNPVIAGEELVAPGIHSDNYVEGTSGFRLGRDGQAEFQNLSVTDTIGASSGVFDDVQIGDDDLGATIGALPSGLIAYGYLGGLSQNTAANSSTSRTPLVELDTGNVYANRYYRISLHGHLPGSVAGDAFDLLVTYTTDGTAPTTTSAVMDGSLTRYNIPTVTSTSFRLDYFYTPAADHDGLRMLFCVVRAAGTGQAYLYLTDINRRFEWAVQDMGPQANADANTAIAQMSFSGTGTVTPPVSSHTSKFLATWSGSYDGDNGARAGGDGNLCYQGYVSSTHGNQRSLVGFDYSAIQSALSGATVTSCKLTFKVDHAYWNDGATVRIGTHNYTSEPSTWNGTNVTEARISKASCKSGVTYTVDLGTGIGGEFKSGSSRGISFGPAPSNSYDYYCYIYGNSFSAEPYLTITYTK